MVDAHIMAFITFRWLLVGSPFAVDGPSILVVGFRPDGARKIFKILDFQLKFCSAEIPRPTFKRQTSFTVAFEVRHPV